MALHDRLNRLERAMGNPEPPAWATWQQDEADPDLFHCIASEPGEQGTTARREDLEGRPRAVLIEEAADWQGTGQPATVMHLPTGLTRVYQGVGRDEGL